MKRHYTAMAAALLAAAACQPIEENKPSLSATPNQITFAATNNAPQTITVTAQQVTWDYSIPQETQGWITIDKEGNTLSVTAADNNSKEARTGQIRIFAENNNKVAKINITLQQEGNADAPDLTLTLDPASLTFVGEGAEPQEVKVTPSVESLTWEAAPEGDAAQWLTVESGEGKFTVSVKDNPSEERRTGKILVTPSDKAVSTKAVIVVQEGKIVPPSLTVTPTDPLEWPYDDIYEQAYLTITAVNCTWTAKAVNEAGEGVNWVSMTPDKNNT